jgi:RND family efflux transporter MFP subunit
MLDVARVDRLRAEFHVPERDAVHIKPGVTKVDLRIDALTGEGATMEATVSRATSSINKANVMIVQVDIDNKEGKLLPGMFIYASILLVTEDGVLTLPANTLHLDDDGKHYVLVAVDGVAKKVVVELKGDDGIRVQIEKGLTGDEQVIAAGLVEPGDAVRIEEAGK